MLLGKKVNTFKKKPTYFSLGNNLLIYEMYYPIAFESKKCDHKLTQKTTTKQSG